MSQGHTISTTKLGFAVGTNCRADRRGDGALTLYDMCKAVDKAMVIRDVRLLKKTKQAL